MLSSHSQSTLELPSNLPDRFPHDIKVIFTDVDDTLTWHGLLPEQTYSKLFQLKEKGIQVVPVTGACAGWCDCIIRTWPITTLIGENGAFWMSKDEQGQVTTHWQKDSSKISDDQARLFSTAKRVQKEFPEIPFTVDQSFRKSDVALDIGQTVKIDEQRAQAATDKLVALNVHAKKSSIHINLWLGEYNKGSTALSWLKTQNIPGQQCLCIGDSANDDSLFSSFEHSVGVANIRRHLPNLTQPPKYITQAMGGYGFAEMAASILKRHLS